MDILTTNSSGKDSFGGIHTKLREVSKYTPKNHIYVIELNREKKYVEKNNSSVIKIDTKNSLGGQDISEVLNNSECFEEFDKRIEGLVNEFQNSIQTVDPDIIMIPGSSLTSYILSKAAKREGKLSKTIHSYAGILEKEIGGYLGNPRAILKKVGRSFTRQEFLDEVTYLFPSNLTRTTLEKEHGIKFPNWEVIPNGISEEFINDSIERQVPDELILGFIGRLHHVKNARYFLDLSDNMDEKAKLKIVTDLRNISSKTDGPSLLESLTMGKVLYHHPMSTGELSEFYRQEVSAIVIPSTFETFCNVAIESLSCGTPALLSDRAGATEVYREYGLDDLIFSIIKLDSFHKALEHAKSSNFKVNPDTIKELREDLSWKKIVPKIDRLIKKVAS
jgi:glycosyltransferase involved in cell wall biosynthesis